MNLHIFVVTAIRIIAQLDGYAAIRVSSLNMLRILIMSERDRLRRIHKFNCLIESGHHGFTDIAN